MDKGSQVNHLSLKVMHMIVLSESVIASDQRVCLYAKQQIDDILDIPEGSCVH